MVLGDTRRDSEYLVKRQSPTGAQSENNSALWLYSPPGETCQNRPR